MTKEAELPSVSVIIPMRNEEADIRRCLQGVLDQDYPKELLEIIVIDGMSQDSSCEIVGEFIDKYPCIKLSQNSKMATTYALNQGIMESGGDIVVRVDAHCCVEPDYVRRCVETLEESGADNVGGLMRPAGDGFIQSAISLAMTCPFGVGTGRFHYCDKEMFVDTVYLGAYPKRVFEKIGLFDEGAHYGEDDEFNCRLIRNGGKIFLSPNIRSCYYPRSSLVGLWRQYYKYGRGKVRTIIKHGRPQSWAHLVPGLFVIGLLTSILLIVINPWFSWLFVAMLATYLMTATLFSVRIAARKGWKYLAILPMVFLTMHVSYGAGFVIGSVRRLLFGRIW